MVEAARRLTSRTNWRSEAEALGALWRNKGSGPHAELAGKKHVAEGGEFLNAEVLIEHPARLAQMCCDLVSKLEESGMRVRDIDRVVGPAYGAIDLAGWLAWCIEKTSGRPCARAYVEKIDGVFRFRKTLARPGECCLPCEDVVNTGGSTLAAREAIQAIGATTVDFIVAIGNRSDRDELGGMEVVSLMTVHACDLTPAECMERGSCAKGSMVLKPDQSNWPQFVSRYR